MSRNLWTGLVAAVVVVALALGVLFLAREAGGPDLTLPDELGGLPAQDSDAIVDQIDDEARRDETRERNRTLTEYNESAVSEALDGAEVAIRSYVSLDDDGPTSLTAMAAATDMGTVVPEGGFPDPETAGFAAPLVERVVEGDVECLVRRISPPLADDEDPDEDDLAPSSVFCQRATGSLTVRVSTGGDSSVQQIAGLVDDLFDDLD